MSVNQKSTGLGDTIAKITHAVGIDVVVEKTANALGIKDCGCKGRQDALNRMFPYGQAIDDCEIFDRLWARANSAVTTKEAALELWNLLGEVPADTKAVLIGHVNIWLVADRLNTVCVDPKINPQAVGILNKNSRRSMSFVAAEPEQLAKGFTGALGVVIVEKGDPDIWRPYISPGGILAVLKRDKFEIERL